MNNNWDTSVDLNRLRGAFTGHFLGDVMGGPFEFRWQNIANYTDQISFPLEFFSRWTGKKLGCLGQSTDDTAMTISLLTLLLTYNGNYSQQGAVQLYQQWASEATMVGKNTRALLKFKVKPENVWPCYLRRYQDKFATAETREQQQSNGAMMRSLPFVLLKDWVKYAKEDCYVTNPSQLAWEVNYLYLTPLMKFIQI